MYGENDLTKYNIYNVIYNIIYNIVLFLSKQILTNRRIGILIAWDKLSYCVGCKANYRD
jgi:hypothetical protein